MYIQISNHTFILFVQHVLKDKNFKNNNSIVDGKRQHGGFNTDLIVVKTRSFRANGNQVD